MCSALFHKNQKKFWVRLDFKYTKVNMIYMQLTRGPQKLKKDNSKCLK